MEVRLTFPPWSSCTDQLWSSDTFLKEVYDHLCTVTRRYAEILRRKSSRSGKTVTAPQTLEGESYVLKCEFHGAERSRGLSPARLEAVVEARSPSTADVPDCGTCSDTLCLDALDQLHEAGAQHRTRPSRLATKRRRQEPKTPPTEAPRPVSPPTEPRPLPDSPRPLADSPRLLSDEPRLSPEIDDDPPEEELRSFEELSRPNHASLDDSDSDLPHPLLDTPRPPSPFRPISPSGGMSARPLSVDTVRSISSSVEEEEIFREPMRSDKSNFDYNISPVPSISNSEKAEPRKARSVSSCSSADLGPQAENSFCLFESPVSGETAAEESPLLRQLLPRKRKEEKFSGLQKSVLVRGGSKLSDSEMEVSDAFAENEDYFENKKSDRVADDIEGEDSDPSPVASRSRRSENVGETSVPAVLPEDDLPFIEHKRDRSRKTAASKKRTTKKRNKKDMDSDTESNMEETGAKTKRGRKPAAKQTEKDKKEKPKPKGNKGAKKDLCANTSTMDCWLNSKASSSVTEFDKPKSRDKKSEEPSHSPMDVDDGLSVFDFHDSEQSIPSSPRKPPDVDVTEKSERSRKLPKGRPIPNFSSSDGTPSPSCTDDLPSMERKPRVRSPARSPVIQRTRRNFQSQNNATEKSEKSPANKWQAISNIQDFNSIQRLAEFTDSNVMLDSDRQHLLDVNGGADLPELSSRVSSPSSEEQTAASLFPPERKTYSRNNRLRNVGSKTRLVDSSNRALKGELRRVYQEEREKLSSPEKLSPRSSPEKVLPPPDTGRATKSSKVNQEFMHGTKAKVKVKQEIKPPEVIAKVKQEIKPSKVKVKEEVKVKVEAFPVKSEADDWTLTSSQKKRRVSVCDMRRRLSMFSPDVIRSDVTADADDVTPPDVIEILDDDEPVAGRDKLDRQIKLVTDVRDLTEEQLVRLVQKHKFTLRDIWLGKYKCERHKAYQRGGKARVNLSEQVYLQRFREEQDDIILNAVMDIFSRGTLQHSEYVFKVLFPEVLVLIFKDVHGIDDYDEAVDEMNNVDFDVDQPLGFG